MDVGVRTDIHETKVLVGIREPEHVLVKLDSDENCICSSLLHESYCTNLVCTERKREWKRKMGCLQYVRRFRRPCMMC